MFSKFTSGSYEKVLSITWKSKDIIPHYNRLSLHTTPSTVTFVATPIFNTKISEVRSVMLGFSVLSTKSASHCSSFLTLDLNIQFLIPVATKIDLLFVAVLNHYSLLILFYLYEITVLI